MRYARLSERVKRVAAMLARRGPSSVVLRDERTATDLRSLSAHLGPEGDLILVGQDLGTGVASLFRYREYEWTVTVAAADIPKLMAALQARRSFPGTLRRPSVLRALQRRFSAGKASELEPFLKENCIPYSLWNRIGD